MGPFVKAVSETINNIVKHSDEYINNWAIELPNKPWESESNYNKEWKRHVTERKTTKDNYTDYVAMLRRTENSYRS